MSTAVSFRECRYRMTSTTEKNVKTGIQNAMEAPQPLDDVGALLRNDDRRLRDDDEHEEGEDQQRD